ncbi:MAG: tetratricopeptide repeat protein [Cyanobacteria bacterium]|nr:tetratricopeptide repeat protein [Cyanobacteria bacterium GSL.Bin1]
MESEEQDYQGAQEKFQQAAAAFEKATTINPDFYEAWRDRANILSDLDKHQQALASINKATESSCRLQTSTRNLYLMITDSKSCRETIPLPERKQLQLAEATRHIIPCYFLLSLLEDHSRLVILSQIAHFTATFCRNSIKKGGVISHPGGLLHIVSDDNNRVVFRELFH